MSDINFQVNGHDVSVRQRIETVGRTEGGVDIGIDGFLPITIIVKGDVFSVWVHGKEVHAECLAKHERHHHHNDKTETIDIGLLFRAVRQLEHDVAAIHRRLGL